MDEFAPQGSLSPLEQDPHAYPHQTGEVDAARLSEDIAAHPDAYHPGLDPHMEANGIDVQRPAFETEAVEAAESEPVRTHNWAEIAATTPLSSAHEQEHKDLGEELDPGYNSRSPNEQRAIAVVAELGSVSAAPPSYEMAVEKEQLKATTADLIVADLEKQRNMQGRAVAEGITPNYSLAEAATYLKSLASTPEGAVKVLSEMLKITQHQVTAYSRLQDVYEKEASGGRGVLNPDHGPAEKRAVAQWMSSYVLGTEPSTLRGVLALPKAERGTFDFMKKNILENIDEQNPLDKQVKARLEGYDSLYDKYRTLGAEGKDLKAENISILDTIYDRDLAPYEMRSRASEYLNGELGIEGSLLDDLLISMEGRIKDQVHEGVTDPYVLVKNLREVSRSVEAIGMENINLLRDKCGIVNIGEMSNEQLQRMVRFAEDDPSLLEELSQKEVCVVIRDATSDWNGAFAGAYQQYETNEGATLMFEVSSMDGGKQMRSYVDLLRQKGVQPSVAVIAGHGSPGSIKFGDGYLTARQPKELNGSSVATLENAGIADLLTGMRPDRDGNCSVIYYSCSQGKPMTEGKEDSTLYYTASLASERGVEGAAYQVLGVDDPDNSRPNGYGDLTTTSGRPFTRIAVGKYGNIYKTSEQTPRLPMFRTKVVDIRKPTTELQEAAA